MSNTKNTPTGETSDAAAEELNTTVAYRPGENVFAVLLLIVALLMCWQAYRISGFTALSSPGAFPMAAAAAMVIGLLVVIIKGIVHRPSAASVSAQADAGTPTPDAQAIAPAVVVIFAGCVLGFAGLLDALGFLPASLLFLLVAIKFLHRGSLLFTFVVSLGSLILIYVVFRLVFSVILPEGIVPESAIMAWVESFFANDGAVQ